MRLVVVRVERQRGAIVRLRFVEQAVLEQDVGEIDPGGRVCRMTGDGLAVGGERGAAMAAGERQAAEIGQRAEVGRVAGQNLEIGLLRGVREPERRQQRGAFEAGVQIVGVRRERGLGRAQRGLVRQALVDVRGRRLTRPSYAATVS
jgi:hypothetical protein